MQTKLFYLLLMNESLRDCHYDCQKNALMARLLLELSNIISQGYKTDIKRVDFQHSSALKKALSMEKMVWLDTSYSL